MNSPNSTKNSANSVKKSRNSVKMRPQSVKKQGTLPKKLASFSLIHASLLIKLESSVLKKRSVWSFAKAKLQAKMRSILAAFYKIKIRQGK